MAATRRQRTPYLSAQSDPDLDRMRREVEAALAAKDRQLAELAAQLEALTARVVALEAGP